MGFYAQTECCCRDPSQEKGVQALRDGGGLIWCYADPFRPMAHIDLLLTAELVLVLLLVATLDCSPTLLSVDNPPLDDPPLAGWTPESDSHAQRILRLESRRGVTPATLS